MSAHIVERRTIDYLVSWWASGLGRRPHYAFFPSQQCPELAILQASHPEVFTTFNHVQYGWVTQFHPDRLTPDVMGGILIAENYRSVNHHYRQVNAPRYRYRFRELTDEAEPEWVIRAADYVDHLSDECPDHRLSLACEINFRIRESAITYLCDRADAPWGICEDPVKVRVARRRKVSPA
jgi:hypothetical protein